MRCVECDRYICPKDFVPTPVGYKCPDCARPLASARRAVKPGQLAISAAVALVVGVSGALLLAVLGLRSWLFALLLGMVCGEAVRRASGGHRTGAIAAVAGAGVLFGMYLSGFGLVSIALGVGGAALYVMSNRW